MTAAQSGQLSTGQAEKRHFRATRWVMCFETILSTGPGSDELVAESG